jgi:hypothetical protein
MEVRIMIHTRKCWTIVPAVLLLLSAACGRAPQADQMKVTLDRGTELRVQPLTTLSPLSDESGDEFTATLESPVMGGAQVAIPTGATLVGEVVETSGKPAPESQAAPYMTLKLKEVIVPGHKSIEIETEPVRYTPAASPGTSMNDEEETKTQPEVKQPSEPPSASMPDEATMTFHLSEPVDVTVQTEQPAPRPVS